MKLSRTLLLPLACAGLHPAAAANVPEGYSAERYEAMWRRSPFTLSSVTEEPVAGFAEQLSLSSIMMVGDEPHVSILNKQTQKRFSVSPGKPSDGIEIVSVTSPSSPREAEALIRKGVETAKIRFDLNLLKATAAAPGPQPPMPQPGVIPQPGSVPQPPGTQPGIQPGTPPNPNAIRTRRRVIIPSQPAPPAPQPPAK